jgi:hypothetical protein
MNGIRTVVKLWRNRMRYEFYGRVIAIAILMSLWIFPAFGECQTATLSGSGNGGMRYYSDSEVGELSEAAEEAIEGAAAEAASLDREGAAQRAAATALAAARHWQGEYVNIKQRG